jgi:hypothetical protein
MAKGLRPLHPNGGNGRDAYYDYLARPSNTSLGIVATLANKWFYSLVLDLTVLRRPRCYDNRNVKSLTLVREDC